MKFCPECGTSLLPKSFDQRTRMACPACNFVDWDNWMNIAVVVIAYNDQHQFAMVRMKSQQAGKLTFPQGFRELGETLEEAARREYLEEAGHQLSNLKLHDIYEDDAKRLIWISFTAQLGAGEFRENEETSELVFFSPSNPPAQETLRGHLTQRLLASIL
jgi:NADH pyrophosphatase NudC (nudix superfamily)